ncbi:MAG: hypothetical protein M5U16_07845 [Hyphomicrobium sp.]|nr:hypothetical protein [Hyphomicrobium sp.]
MLEAPRLANHLPDQPLGGGPITMVQTDGCDGAERGAAPFDNLAGHCFL